jgi:aspartate-semialdehyde dehydrogenase
MAEIVPRKFAHRIAFNVLPEIGKDSGNGYTDEEMKLVNESRKIMHLPDLLVSATCVRVPVFFCHSEAAHLSFKKPLAPDQAREILRKAPGVKVIDDLEEHIYPMPLLAAGDDDSLGGRNNIEIAARKERV